MNREIVDALIGSLNDPNAGWEYGKYTAENNRIKCQIWLGNGPGSIDVDFYGPKIFGDSHSVKTFRVGHTLLFHPRWARRIYSVARPLQLAALTGRDAKAEAKIIAAIRSASTPVDAEAA